MAIHAYEDDFDIVDDGSSWNQYESCTMRRGPQQPPNHMAQQVTRKVASAYEGKTSFFACEDALDYWRDTTELEPEKRVPELRNRLEEMQLWGYHLCWPCRDPRDEGQVRALLLQNPLP